MNKNHCIESLKDLTTHCYVATVDLETIQYAIKSIEAWEKVIEDINYLIEHGEPISSKLAYTCCRNIINKHLGEIEEKRE